MLYTKKQYGSNLKTFALLLFISGLTFHSPVFANEEINTAEEYRDLGFIEQQKGNLPQALSYYIKAIELGLENPVVLNDIGIIYEKIDLRSKAEQYYLQSLQVDENYLPAYMNLAYLYQTMGQQEPAFQYFKKRYEKGDLSDPWTQKAKEETLKIHPEFITWVVTNEAKSLNKELVNKAHEDFTKRVSLANEHFRKGQEFEKIGHHTQALTEYDEALRLTPHNPRIVDAKKNLKMQQVKEDFERRSAQAMKMLESGNTMSAKQEIQNMLATIPNE